MAAYNRIIMVGNLTRDPEYKQLSSGQGVCRIGLASNRQFKNRQSGDMVQEVCYVDVDVWGAQAESCRQYLQKGRQILVEGRLKLDSWQDQEGKNRSKHSIVADRVVFLATANGAEVSTSGSYEVKDSKDEGMQGARLDPNNPAERELLDQIDSIKARTKKPKEAKNTASEVDFKDEPPFQDDLPF